VPAPNPASDPAAAPIGPVRVTLLSKPNCHLCDVAREVIDTVTAELGIGWTQVDVTADPEPYLRWADQLPVTLVDGEPHDVWRVSADRLRAALTA
jgi:glutaredoxin